MKRTLLALSALVVVAQASFNPVQTIKNKLFKREKVQAENDAWPVVHWPVDFEAHGNLYTWNNETQKLELFAHTQLDEYIDSTGNREKIITQMDVPGIGFAEIITFVDANTHKVYQKIPKIEKCSVYDLPPAFNLTTLVHALKDPSANITTYLGVKTLPWAGETTYHAFHIDVEEIKETVYFCTKCHEVKWITIDTNGYILGTPKGTQDRVFTDADFDGATCQSSEPSTFIQNPKRRIMF